MIIASPRSPYDEPEPPNSQQPTKTHLAIKTRLIFSSQLFPVHSVALFLVASHSSYISTGRAFLCKTPSQRLPLAATCPLFAAVPPDLTLLQPGAVPGHLPLSCSAKGTPEWGEGKLAFGCHQWLRHVPADVPVGTELFACVRCWQGGQ